MKLMLDEPKEPDVSKMSVDEYRQWQESPLYQFLNNGDKFELHVRIQTFDAAFKSDQPAVEYDCFWLFCTGAMRDMSSKGPLLLPPTNKYERAQLLKVYWQRRAESATRAFNRHRNDLIGAARNGLNAPPGHAASIGGETELSELKRLRAEAQRMQKMLRLAEQAVADHTPVHIQRRAEHDARAREHTSKYLHELERLTL